MAEVQKKRSTFRLLLHILTGFLLVGLLFAYLSPFVHPNTFRLLPFFGLAYPIIIVLTLVVLLFWIFLRSRISWVIAICLLLGGKLHFRILATGGDKENLPPDKQLLHVMSYNVRLFDLYTAETDEKYTNRNAIFNYIQSNNPDIICFQEFYHQDKPTSFSTRDTLIQLLQIKDYHERYAHKLNGRQNFGVAILSKYPLIAKGDVMFHTQGAQDFNYCVFVDIVKNKDTFRVYNVHLQSIKLQQDDYSVFDKSGGSKVVEKPSMLRLLLEKLTVAYPKRAEQARTVVEHIQSSPYPTIVCGDFNDTPLSYAYNQFNRLLVDAFRNCASGIGTTYVGKVPAGRIDYIFHSPELESSHFHIQEKAFSDHRAISCKIYHPKIATQ
jgi:endonuclease/exonuclease/phosphatase family metal-dependent hydrolase